MKRRMLLCLMFGALAMVSQAQIPPVAHINVNNVNGTILGDGSYFLDQRYEDGYGYAGNITPMPCPTWEVPAGSGQITVFQHALWFGGLDSNDSLHLAAMRFGQGPDINGGQDYWAGPLRTTDASIDLMTSVKYHHIWNLTRAEIEQFIANHGNAGYKIPEDILTWPAHGEGNYASNLAPFVDVNNDGHYNPEDGDYPDIKGDQCLFFIFNDNFAAHTESQGGSIGLEVHAMVYAFDAPDDEALNNTVFTNYKFFNRSLNDYHNTYLGLFYDWDLGYSSDDYVGCDVSRNACFVYNGLEIDGNGQPWAYGENWPVQVTTVLAGPDNGNGRLGMTGFLYFNNDNSTIGDPRYPEDYYLYLQARWKDGNYLMYGGNGYPGTLGVVGPECHYMYPGDSDPDNIGTNGTAPNGGYNTNGKYWTDEEAGNAPADRRGLAMVGPFSFPAGGVQELDYAAITVWKNNTQTAMERKGEFIDHIREFFNNGLKK